jgi:S1-C subfamily serine protease
MRSLDDLERLLERLPDARRTTVRFVQFDDPRTERQRVITNDREWFPAQRCKRDDETGLWPCRELAPGPPAQVREPQTTTFPPQPGDRYIQRIIPSLVLVNFDMPYTVSGVSDRHYYGTGLIVDAERGLVVVDRNTVPVAMGDVRITFAGSLEIPGRVEYVHPLHNLSIVSYDPALIGDTQTRSAVFTTDEVLPGDLLAVVGLKADHKLSSQSSEVASVEAVNFPLSRTLRFRESNLEGITLVNGPNDFDGVIVNQQGRVAAFWATFAYQTGRDLTQVNMGIPAELIVDMVARVQNDSPLRSLEIEWRHMPLATARKLDLPESWVERYESHNERRRQVLAVASVVAGSPAAEFFRTGDILLGLDGEPMNTFREVELATQRPDVEVTVFRDGREVTERVGTVELSGEGLQRVVLWAGALVQTPHRAISAQRGIDSHGVYVAYFAFGSPASRSGLFAGRRIIGVNGQPTLDMDSFLEAVDGLGDRVSVRLNTVTWNSVPQVITLKLDNHYWPSYELRREDDGWRRYEL